MSANDSLFVMCEEHIVSERDLIEVGLINLRDLIAIIGKVSEQGECGVKKNLTAGCLSGIVTSSRTRRQSPARQHGNSFCASLPEGR